MKQRVLIELDALLDTRLSTIALLNPVAAKGLVSNDKYYNRMSDEFNLLDESINMEAYREAYAKRDVVTLMGARPTALVLLIAHQIRDLELRLFKGEPDITALAVDINTHPYQLQSDEIEALLKAIREVCSINVCLEQVYIPPDKLTTTYIKNSNWAAIYLYNFTEWDTGYLATLTESPVSVAGVTMFIPEMVNEVSKINTDLTLIPATGKRIKPHHALAILLSETIGIEPLDAKMFSIIRL